MENYQDNNEHDVEKDDIINPEQFQVGRSPQEDKEASPEQEMVDRNDDAGYTPEENQFADGLGTQLNEEIDADTEDNLDEENKFSDK